MTTILLAIYLTIGGAHAQGFGPLSTKNVHGKFARTQVKVASEFRYQITGLITDLKTESTCTGTLIGPRHVITAAHCVYDFDTKKWSESFEFIPGKLFKDDTREGRFRYKKFFVQKEYIKTKGEEYDFAIVELDNPAGDSIGWAGYRALTDEETALGSVFPITFAGYPGDKDYGTLWSVSCPGTIKEDLFWYFCDSFGGMSGSALFRVDDDQNYIIGVHTWGGIDQNGGVFFNDNDYQLIFDWINSSKYSTNTVLHLKK